ncbi:helix-turn-helix transcriptional regulator [Streptomyces sp. NPDC006134]|uniref:helix-turn-helix domain-containing protein n=1 Tax=Streptomyces sp. NPDC006134 TaxID=3154467 RepID=UPI0033D2C367
MGSAAQGHLVLGEFLKAKRAGVSPEDVGLPDSGRPRRVPGLRREEVAQLADVSVDYYTRLEQGRTTQASDAVLSGIAKALRLTPAEWEYLRLCARAPVRPVSPPPADSVSPATQALLDSMVRVPAVVLGRRMDVIGWNAMGSALFTDLSRIEPRHRNLARMVFLEPRVRALYPDWRDVAGGFVERLRMDATRYPDDPRLHALVDELSERDPDFRHWWARHAVRGVTSGRKRVRHPVAGELTLDWQALRITAAPEQTIIVHTAAEDTGTRRGFEALAQWADHLAASARTAG